MPKGFARVAAVSVPVHLGKVDANVQEILSAMQKLREKHVQAAVFPQLCLTGATMGDLLLRSDVQRAAWDGMQAIAKKTKEMAVVVGLPVCVRSRLYNCAAVLWRGHVMGLVPQADPQPGGLFDNSFDLFSHTVIMGEEVEIGCDQLFDMGAFSFAVELCPGERRAGHENDNMAIRLADVILNPAASPAVSGCHQQRRERLKQRSASLCAGYVYAGAGFGESTADWVFDGCTAVCENGDVLCEGPRFSMEGGMAVADVDVDRLRYQRMRHGLLRTVEAGDRIPPDEIPMPAMEAPLPLLRPLEPLPFVPGGPDAQERLAEMADMQCMGLCSRMRAIRGQNLVIGVSGGLDSTLALLVAVRSFDLLGLDRKGIHAITMPGMGTGARTKGNADRLMEALGVSALEIPIGPAVKQHFADIGQPEDLHDVTYENAQARERTQILMDYANKVGGIVLGTGDLSESALGFCTYNGDHMSMYNVNASVPKTLVKSLTRYLGASFGEPAASICLDVVNTPISPELLPVTEGELNQRTEDILGDYALHDFFLYHFMDGGASREKLLLLAGEAFRGVYGADKITEQLNTFWRRFHTQQFKRNCMPDGPCVTGVSLSPRGSWNMPSDMRQG